MSHWSFHPVGDYPLTIAMGIALLASVLLLGVRRGRLSAGKIRVLTAIRLAIFVLLLLALLRPTLVHTTKKKQSATLAFMIDTSRSMQVADAFGGKRRWDALTAAVNDAMPTLNALAEDFEVKVYGFDMDLKPIEFDDRRMSLPSLPEGQETAIGAGLEDLLRREAGKRLIGTIMLSDGAQRAYAPRATPPQTPARRLAELGCPIYAFAFGQAREQGQGRDIAVKEFLVNPTVYVKNQLTAVGVIRTQGFIGKQLTAQLLFESNSGKDAVVASKNFRPTSDGDDIRVEMSYTPDTPGEYRVTLRVEPQEGEIATTNNELSSFVTVLSGGVKVLYVEGGPRVEQKFLARYSLDASTDLNVDYVELVNGDSKTRKEDLLAKITKGGYDVYILGDVDATSFTPEELKALATNVSNGAGLLMLGGFHAFGPGGYQKTPLANLAPINMNDLERQRPGDPPRLDVHINTPVKMKPAKDLLSRSYVMNLAPAAENDDAWNRLPALDGANRFKRDAIKPTAQVLAESNQGDPLLVAHEAGGRVMAFAGDTTWHWWMEGFQEQHKRFWRQVILWLAHKDESTQGSVWVKLPQRRYAPGSRVEFTTGARDAQGSPAPDATFEAVVLAPGGEKHPVHLTRQGEAMTGAFFQTKAPGDYTVEVTATLRGAALGSARTRFLVFSQDLELDNAAADPSLLASLAAITREVGGQSLAPEELSRLLDDIKKHPPDLEVDTERKETYWDTWPFMMMFMGLMCVDWFLRKKWGLA